MKAEELLLTAFWRCLKDDLSGHGCTSDGLKGSLRRLPYSERVIIEHEQLRIDAESFISTSDFNWWAEQSNLNPEHLRIRLYADAH